MPRYRQDAAGLHVLERLVDGQVGGVALRRRGQVRRRLRQDDPRLGHAHEVRRVQGRHGYGQAARVSITDILRSKDDQAPRYEARILAGVQHLGQPVDCRMRVGAAHTLDEGGNRVVVPVFVMVVHHGFRRPRG